MKTKTHTFYLMPVLNLNQTIFVIGILFSTVGVNANQCISLFMPLKSEALSVQRSRPEKTVSLSKKPEFKWSNNSDLFIYNEGLNQIAIHTTSGKKNELGHDRPIFSNEGDSVSVFSTKIKTLITRTGPDLQLSSVEINADHIVDIRGQHVIAQRKNEKGYFIFSLQTGELLNHIATANSYLKLKYSKSAAFVTEPNIKGLTTQKGVVENVSLNDLTTEFQTIHRQVFDDVDPNYKSDDFLKVKSGTHDKLIRKSDLTEYKIGADFVRAYDVDPAKKIFVIQTTNEIAVYKNGKLDLSRHFEHANDIQIVGFSEKENAYLGYDAKLGKLFSTMVIWDSIQIGPDADITYFKPKMVGPSTILFQKSNGRFYRWGIQTNPADKSRLYVAIVDAATANGVSGNPKFVAGYNNKLEKWEFKEIVMGDKK